MKRLVPLALIGSSLLSGMSVAHAETYANTQSAEFTVRFGVLAHCRIAANPLDFGTSGNLALALNSESTLEVTCTDKTPYNVGLDAGTAIGTSIANRLLAGAGAINAGASISYQLYRDATRQDIWGNSQGTDTLTGMGNGSPQVYPVFGQIPSQPLPAPGAYLSTVTATVYF